MKARKATISPTRMPFFCPWSEVDCTTLSMIPVSASRSKALVESVVSNDGSPWPPCEYMASGASEDCTRMLANSLENGISARVVSQPTPANSAIAEVAWAAATILILGGGMASEKTEETPKLDERSPGPLRTMAA
jgi:hypothetical protein